MARVTRRQQLLQARRAEDPKTTRQRVEASEYVIDSGAGSLLGEVPQIKDAKHADEILAMFMKQADRHSASSI